ncbi:hypothetical protein HN446_05330 [bacterium]|jgi:hypothetical protein|nr:hypothetical protein [bacterium]
MNKKFSFLLLFSLLFFANCRSASCCDRRFYRRSDDVSTSFRLGLEFSVSLFNFLCGPIAIMKEGDPKALRPYIRLGIKAQKKMGVDKPLPVYFEDIEGDSAALALCYRDKIVFNKRDFFRLPFSLQHLIALHEAAHAFQREGADRCRVIDTQLYEDIEQEADMEAAKARGCPACTYTFAFLAPGKDSDVYGRYAKFKDIMDLSKKQKKLCIRHKAGVTIFASVFVALSTYGLLKLAYRVFRR